MGKKKPTSEDGAEAKKPATVKLASIVLCIALAGGGYVMGGRSASASPNGAETSPTTSTIPSEDGCEAPAEEGAHGVVVDLPSMSINLADGHYLRVAVSLGLCHGVGVAAEVGHGAAEEAPAIVTAPAQDIVVEELSGASMDHLATEAGRTEAKESLTHHIREAYPAVVAEVFLVEFVMQ